MKIIMETITTTAKDQDNVSRSEQLTVSQIAVRKMIGLLNSFKRWMFLNVWCSRLYRPTMRTLHYFNLHYAPPSQTQMSLYGERDHWCQWCGLRGTSYRYKNTTL